jgi:hypothetical protein
MSLYQAPRFHAWFSHLEGRQVMVMVRRDWDQVNGQLREGEMMAIDVSRTPIASVAQGSRIEAAVAVRATPVEVVVEVYRYDPVDMPLPINLDRYKVWEQLPPHRDLATMVISASTEDNSNMPRLPRRPRVLHQGRVVGGHHLADLPERVKALVRRPDGAAS